MTGKTLHESLNCAGGNTSNQLNTCFTYDAAGNVIKNGSVSYTYDAENRLIATAGMSYVYDGDGNRIEKCTEGATPGTCATNATGTLYFLHAGGGTLAESNLGGNWTAAYGLIHGQIISRVDLPANVVHYYSHDHLGSTSVVTDANGDIENESDYYPYGGEIVITSGDSNRYKFTGKERDAESGNGYMFARYYNSATGRFLSPDWSAKEDPVPYAKLDDPQTLNLYGYVANNPLTREDPDGHAFGLDDLVGALAGGAVGVGVEVVKDLATGQKITTGAVVGAAAGGALFGEGIVNAPETLGGSVVLAAAAKGAVQGAVSNAVQQGVDIATGEQKSFNGKSLAVSTAVGALTEGIASKVPLTKVPGITSGQGNMKAVAEGVSTKIANGTVSRMSMKTAVKGAIGGQVANAGKTVVGAAADVAAKKTCSATGSGGCN